MLGKLSGRLAWEQSIIRVTSPPKADIWSNNSGIKYEVKYYIYLLLASQMNDYVDVVLKSWISFKYQCL